MNEQLPDGWVESSLIEIADFQYGKGLLTKELTEEGFPVFGANGIIGFYSSFLYKEPKIIISCRGAASGVVHKTVESSFVTSNSIVINEVAPHLVNLDYLKYVLDSRHKSSIITGSAQPQITVENLKDFKIILAPLAEQARIVAALDGLMARVRSAQEQLATVPKLLKRFRQSVLSAAVSGQLTEDWRAENPDVESAEELILKIKAERYEAAKTINQAKSIDEYFALQEEGEYFDIPEKWSFVSLGKICYSFNYGTSQKSDSGFGKVPVLRMGNLQNGKIDWSDLKYTSDDNEIEKYELKSRDVLFNRTNSPELVGKTSIYRGEQPAIFAGYLIRINNVPQLNSDYLNYVLNSDYAREWCLMVKSDGVSQSNINAQKLSAFELPFCSIDEQQEIVNRVSSLLDWAEKLEDNYKLAKQQLDALPAGILAKAFAGELTEQDPADEPASVLLERIRAERLRQQQEPKPKKAGTKTAAQKQRKKMAEQLQSIKAILATANAPVPAHTVWQQSEHKDDIEAFYADLKQLVDVEGSVEDVKEGDQSFLKLTHAD